YKVTSLCHGQEKAQNAMETAIKVFEQGALGDDLPTVSVELSRLENGVSCLDLFLEAGLTASKGESRRLIRGKGAKVNDKQIVDENMILDHNYLVDGVIKLSAGKKKHVLVKT
ncbi:MAG: tyrosine--tRNA ligase, partial [Pseudomonadota bacterium]